MMHTSHTTGKRVVAAAMRNRPRAALKGMPQRPSTPRISLVEDQGFRALVERWRLREPAPTPSLSDFIRRLTRERLAQMEEAEKLKR